MRERRLVIWLFLLLVLIGAFWLVSLVWVRGKNIILGADTAGWLAYVTDKEGPTHIWYIKPDGTQVRAEPSSDADDTDPCWQQPDGRTLFFTSNRNDRVEQIFHLSPANQEVNPLTLGGARKSDLHSSKNGHRILYISGGLVSLFTFRLGENQSEQIIPPPELAPGQSSALMEQWKSEFGTSSFKSVTWGKSEDNILVGIIGGDEGDALVIQQYDARERKQQQPTIAFEARRIDVAYHPTEDKLAVSLWHERPVGGAIDRPRPALNSLAIVDITNKRRMQLFQTGKDDQILLSPSWSPDGTKLAVVRAVVKNGEPVGVALLVVALPTGQGTEMTTTPIDTGQCDDPQWSPDGKKIAYTKGPPGNRDIYIFDSDTGKPVQVTLTGDDYFPRWSPKIKESQQ